MKREVCKKYGLNAPKYEDGTICVKWAIYQVPCLIIDIYDTREEARINKRFSFRGDNEFRIAKIHFY